jgi:hypothetical protein
LDKSQPAIARATALPLLPQYMSAASEPAIKAAIADPDPLGRMAVPQALPPSASRAMIDAILPLLTDPVRAVRVETARVMAAAIQKANVVQANMQSESRGTSWG